MTVRAIAPLAGKVAFARHQKMLRVQMIVMTTESAMMANVHARRTGKATVVPSQRVKVSTSAMIMASARKKTALASACATMVILGKRAVKETAYFSL